MSSPNSPKSSVSRVLFTLTGLILGLGAPIGWLLVRMASVHNGWARAEIQSNLSLYLYMAIGTTVAFAAFGFSLGTKDDHLRVRADETEKAFEQAQSLAITDALTGVSNARRLHDHLSMEVDLARRYSTAISCLMIDIDDFKRVNDQHGHPFGDTVLTSIARTVRDCVRQSDLVGRLGGEEFLVVMRYTTAAAAYQVAERIRTTIERYPFLIDGESVTVTVSIGIAGMPSGTIQTKADLLKATDDALYTAKRKGKNQTAVQGSNAQENPALAVIPLARSH